MGVKVAALGNTLMSSNAQDSVCCNSLLDTRLNLLGPGNAGHLSSGRTMVQR